MSNPLFSLWHIWIHKILLKNFRPLSISVLVSLLEIGGQTSYQMTHSGILYNSRTTQTLVKEYKFLWTAIVLKWQKTTLRLRFRRWEEESRKTKNYMEENRRYEDASMQVINHFLNWSSGPWSKPHSLEFLVFQCFTEEYNQRWFGMLFVVN